MSESSADVVKRYLHDAGAAEKSFETGLHALADEAVASRAKQILIECALVSRDRHERLTNRLTSLGGNVSDAKGLFAHLFGLASASPQVENHGPMRIAQDFVTALALGHSEIARYEALAIIAEAAGDSDTADLARVLQHEIRTAAGQLLDLLPSTIVYLPSNT